MTSFDGTMRSPYEPAWSRAVYHLYRGAGGRIERTHAARWPRLALAPAFTIRFPSTLQKRLRRICDTQRVDLPVVSERVAAEILSLPMYPGLESDQQE